ncbi:hypothetical protein QYE76_036218 [Lolium multiflorum]|uniref:Uncharacterized protein n=1 Tax=Lolium multiflorum TaxID=4521 RepID=A0AAD8VPR8_LOLMU|nr:hypothetical protein QYE76_036218 [Lolium multiflorum]
MKMAVVSMEEPSGALPGRRVEQRLMFPDLGFAMAAALEGYEEKPPIKPLPPKEGNEKKKKKGMKKKKRGNKKKEEPVEEEIDEPESSLDEKEEEIDELESSLDEKEEESDEQKEEEWISYPCQPSNESNSLSLTLFDCPPCLPKEVECYVPVDSLEIFPISKTCENDYATVIYDNPCYFDKSYDNALFVPDVEMHGCSGNILELDKINAKDLIFPGRLQNTEGEEESQGATTHVGRAATLAAPAWCGATLSPSCAASSPI